MNILTKISLIISDVFIIALLIKSWYIVKNIPSALIFFRKNKKNDSQFPYYGMHFYCGRQGSGKTYSMTHELEQIRKKYPKCKIYTNYGYKYQNLPIYNINMLTDEKYCLLLPLLLPLFFAPLYIIVMPYFRHYATFVPKI